MPARAHFHHLFALGALTLKCAVTVEALPETPPDWPCYIGVWACAPDEARLVFHCPLCAERVEYISPSYAESITCAQAEFPDCSATNYVAILPTGRVLQWVATYSQRTRAIAGSPLPGAWYWHREGGELVLEGLEGHRAKNCGNRNLCRSQVPPTSRVRRLRADRCQDDTFDEIAERLTPADFTDAHASIPYSLSLEDITHPRICRRLEPALAAGILRTVNAEEFDLSRFPGLGPIYYY